MKRQRTRRRALLGRLRLAGCLLIGAGFVCAPRAAHAEERRNSARHAQLVVVDYPNSAFTDPELHAAVRELLSRIQVRAVSVAQAGDPDVIAYAHISVGRDEATVTVEAAHGERPTARRSLARGDSPALLRETLAHVLLGLVEPLTEGGEPDADGVPRVDVDRSASRRGFAPQLGAHGGPIWMGSDAWSARFVASGALVWGGRLGPALGLDASAALPVSIDEEGVKARALLGGARVRGRIDTMSRPRFALDAALSLGFDVFSVRAKSVADGSSVGGASRKAQPVLGVAMGARARVHPRMELALGIGLDLDPLPRSWVLDDAGMERELFATSAYRPYATLGVDWLPQAQPARSRGEAAP